VVRVKDDPGKNCLLVSTLFQLNALEEGMVCACLYDTDDDLPGGIGGDVLDADVGGHAASAGGGMPLAHFIESPRPPGSP